MTILDLYRYSLVEMNKVEAPSLILEEYNYLMNKAVQQYINKVYNRYDINQQSSDDLRVLKATAEVVLEKKSYTRIKHNWILYDFTDSKWQNTIENNTIDATIDGIRFYSTRAYSNPIGIEVFDESSEANGGLTFNSKNYTAVTFSCSFDADTKNAKVVLWNKSSSKTINKPVDVNHTTVTFDLEPNNSYRLYMTSDNNGHTYCYVKFAEPITRRVANKDKFIYEGILPKDYVHILNCLVDYRVDKNFGCYRKDDYIEFGAKRLTADLIPAIEHNVYMKPDYKRPYFYIHNNNTSINADLAPNNDGNLGYWNSTHKELDSEYLNSTDRDTTNPDGNRTANISNVRIEIRFGDDDTVFVPEYLYIDYIKAPMYIELTYDDITSTEDKTRTLEFPDYVCYEIVNEFVKLLMENSGEARLQTHYAVNQTIADPTAAVKSQSGDKS